MNLNTVMKALIIDDERLARNELRRMLSAHDQQVEVVGEAKNAEEALQKIEQLDPDLLFLDVQMPGQDGFQLLEEMDRVPKVIFTTAYDEYALKAFDVNALDYLMKPIAPERLASALEKMAQKQVARAESPAAMMDANQQVFVKDGERCWFVPLKEIALFESEGNYTRVYFGPNQPLLMRSLNHLEERIDPSIFFRASRKHLVNLRAIAAIEPWVNGGFVIKLKNGKEVEMSRRQAQKFKDVMAL